MAQKKTEMISINFIFIAAAADWALIGTNEVPGVDLG